MKNKVILVSTILSGLIFVTSICLGLKNPDTIKICGSIKDVGYKEGKHAYFYGYITDKGIKSKVKFKVGIYNRYISGEEIIMCDNITSVSFKKITGVEYPGIDYSKLKNWYPESMLSFILIGVSFILYVILSFIYIDLDL